MGFFADVIRYLQINGETVLQALLEHIWLALLPVLIAFVLAVPIGWLVVRVKPLSQIILAGSSVMYTIPSLALLLLLPGIIGTSVLDTINVVIALTLYSVALLVRTSADALGSIDDAAVQAAVSMGYGPVRRWFTIDLPLAMPVLLTGLRVATVANVSMVSVAALIGIGGLGQLFTRGFQLGFYAPPIVIGLVLSVLLAVVADLAIVAVQRLATPWTRAGKTA
ncbi:ABC transporter permease [Naumannella halotolerans]|uniref:Osmoprotectant transport system permease protein n=1 Tax=Naumannella halotolerans TaxID=993414 RepID=A0A4R7J5F1_9ACTN|nr:ABC transporter permease subunit [Naumannella halotolerans]TDT32581.1 osmoprotectant transport system permease protein [Naumannella halotolerans]